MEGHIGYKNKEMCYQSRAHVKYSYSSKKLLKCKLISKQIKNKRNLAA